MESTTTRIAMHGWLVLDKPSGLTSREVLDRVAKRLPRRTKLGHTGTLDPRATGVLVACVGAATRLAESVQAMPKKYRALIRLGATSDTDDADGEIAERSVADPPTLEDLQKLLPQFLGTILQMPPAYSAVKVDGKRAHALARRGREVELAPRPVRIDSIGIERYEWPMLELTVDCGKGTYIRSLARDLGEALGCGGMIQELRRSKVGPFTDDNAMSLDASRVELVAAIRPIPAGLPEMGSIVVDDDGIRRIRQGQRLPVEAGDGDCMIVDGSGTVIAIGRVDDGRFRSEIVLFGLS